MRPQIWTVPGFAINIVSPSQDPPSFQVFPKVEYLQEVGRELIIPCQAHGDPAPNITWTKVCTHFSNIMIKKLILILLILIILSLLLLNTKFIFRVFYDIAVWLIFRMFLVLYFRLEVRLTLHLLFCPVVLWFCSHSWKTIKGHGSVMLPTLWQKSVKALWF